MDGFELSISGVGLLGALYILYCSFISPLRPFLIPVEGWHVAFALVRSKPKAVAFAVLVIAFGDGLQEFFTYGPAFNRTVLTLASVGWQAIMAALLAMIAVPLHLHMIQREPKGLLAERLAGRPTTFLALLLRAALLGGTIWFVGYLIDVFGRFATISVPGAWTVIVYRGVQLLGFVIASLLALVRPSLSSGLLRPVRTGLGIAVGNFPSVILVKILLLIPPIAFNVIAIQLVRAYFGLSLGVHVFNDVSIVLFSTLQYLAVEASTVILTRAAILRPDPTSTAYGFQGAYARPY